MPLTQTQYMHLARHTLAAEEENRTIPMLTQEFPDLTREEGYQIQRLRAQLMQERGHKLIGYKMGATSLAKRIQMGSKMPSYGRLFAHYLRKEGESLFLDQYIHPKLENEITFVLGRDLSGPFVSVPDVMNATAHITASFEILDSRYHNFKFTGPDVLADNISARGILLGSVQINPNELDLAQLGCTMWVDGEDVAYGTGAEILGHPARAVAELVNLLWTQERESLKAGMLVMTGSVTPAKALVRGEIVKTVFSRLGSLSLHVE